MMEMTIFKENAFFCLSLELCGMIIGWLGLVVYVLAAILFIAFNGMGFCMIPCDWVEYNVYGPLNHYLDITIEDKRCGFAIFLSTLLFLGSICIFSAPSSIHEYLIKGIKKREPTKILPAIVMYTILSVWFLISTIFSGSIIDLALTYLSIYITLVSISLWEKIKNEQKARQLPYQQVVYPSLADEIIIPKHQIV